MKKLLITLLLVAPNIVRAQEITPQQQAIIEKLADGVANPQFVEVIVTALFNSPEGDKIWSTLIDGCEFTDAEKAKVKEQILAASKSLEAGNMSAATSPEQEVLFKLFSLALTKKGAENALYWQLRMIELLPEVAKNLSASLMRALEKKPVQA